METHIFKYDYKRCNKEIGIQGQLIIVQHWIREQWRTALGKSPVLSSENWNQRGRGNLLWATVLSLLQLLEVC